MSELPEHRRRAVVFSADQWDAFRSYWGFTAREENVLRLMCQGWSYEEIAEDLNIKYNTAKALMQRIYARMGVHNRHEAVIEMVSRLR